MRPGDEPFMNLNDVKKEMGKRSLLTAVIVGTILNLINNSDNFTMVFESDRLPWWGLGKVFATYMIPFIVAFYSQRYFMSIYLALINVKNAFYMANGKGKVVFVSNKLVDELNKNNEGQSGYRFNYCNLLGVSIKNLYSKFGFDEYETEELLKNFKENGEVDGHNQIIGKLVNGKRYGLVASQNLALVQDPCFPAQGMFIPKDDLSQMELGAVMMLAKAAESKDENTGKHIMRMRKGCRALGQKMGLSEDDLEILDLGSILHDVGKIGIEDKILNKPGKLTPDEWEIMKTHTSKGGEILRNGNDAFFDKVAVIPEQHHENFDGTGYPKGLKGDAIDLLAGIVAVVDTFDALASKRPYKEKFSKEEIFQEMESQRNKKFDPTILDAFYETLKAEKNQEADFLSGKA